MVPHVELLRWCSLGVFTNEWGSDISETRGKSYILIMRQAHLKAHPKGTKEVPHKLPFSSWFKVCKQKKEEKKKDFMPWMEKSFGPVRIWCQTNQTNFSPTTVYTPWVQTAPCCCTQSVNCVRHLCFGFGVSGLLSGKWNDRALKPWVCIHL